MSRAAKVGLARAPRLAALATALALVAPAVVAAQVETPVAPQVTVEAQIASAITDRMPQNAGTSFPADVGTLFCWVSVTGAAGSSIQHVWSHGSTQFTVDLEIGGSPWRTWSSKEIPPEWTGPWTVEIRDAEGTLLETLEFTVGTGSPW